MNYKNNPDVIARRKELQEKKKGDEKHKEYVAFKALERIARKKNLPHDLTIEQWKDTLNYFDHKCAYCGESKELQKDHFIPVTKKGAYSKYNIVPACKRCNLSKNNRHPRIFLKNENKLFVYYKIVYFLTETQPTINS